MKLLGVTRAASLWYPVMLAQERGEISEAKAAELLGMHLIDYRCRREDAIQAVMQLVTNLPSPLTSLLEAIAARPEWFERTDCSASSSHGADKQDGSA